MVYLHEHPYQTFLPPTSEAGAIFAAVKHWHRRARKPQSHDHCCCQCCCRQCCCRRWWRWWRCCCVSVDVSLALVLSLLLLLSWPHLSQSVITSVLCRQDPDALCTFRILPVFAARSPIFGRFWCWMTLSLLLQAPDSSRTVADAILLMPPYLSFGESPDEGGSEAFLRRALEGCELPVFLFSPSGKTSFSVSG